MGGGTRSRRLAASALVALATLGAALAASVGARATTLPAGRGAPHEHAVPPFETRLAPPAHPVAASGQEAVGHLLVEIPHAMPLTARPGGGRVVGTMPATSRFYHVPLVSWVIDVSRDGRYGLVPLPYAGRDEVGWIRLRGLDEDRTRIEVVADLSEHRLVVLRGDRVILRAPAATGSSASPTPTGRYFVTDRVPFPYGGSLGTFAFGISGIQPNLPAGWTGGDQLAIHGTDAPGTIGTSASAGCLRVSEPVLARLRHLLRLGTPVLITR